MLLSHHSSDVSYILYSAFSSFFFFVSTFSPGCQYLHAFINEVTILVPVLNDSKHTFAIYTPERTKQRWPIRLAAATELEMYDWVGVKRRQYILLTVCKNTTYNETLKLSITTVMYVYVLTIAPLRKPDLTPGMVYFHFVSSWLC